jgi:hypothetical protein
MVGLLPSLSNRGIEVPPHPYHRAPLSAEFIGGGWSMKGLVVIGRTIQEATFVKHAP